VERGARADGIDPLHRHRRRGELPPRRNLPGQRRARGGHKRQGNRVLGQPHAFQQQHGRQAAHAEHTHRSAAHFFPEVVHQLLAGPLAPLAMAAVPLRPHGRQRQVVGRSGQALGGPARHGHAVGIGVVHLLVQGKAAALQAVDHVQRPQRSRAVQHRHVQPGDEVIQGLPVVAAARQPVVEDVLRQIDGRRGLPVRHRLQRKADDAVEGRLDVGERQVFPVEVLDKSGPRFGRGFADQQSSHVLRAGLGLGNEKTQVEKRQRAHDVPNRARNDEDILALCVSALLRSSPHGETRISKPAWDPLRPIAKPLRRRHHLVVYHG
jgi:hypothetical protein